jgi:hypothetical protein
MSSRLRRPSAGYCRLPLPCYFILGRLQKTLQEPTGRNKRPIQMLVYIARRAAPHAVNHLRRNHLLLLTQVIAKELAPRDVPRVHPGHRVVHQEVHVQIANACSLGNGTVRLAKIVAPFPERASVLFVLD